MDVESVISSIHAQRKLWLQNVEGCRFLPLLSAAFACGKCSETLFPLAFPCWHAFKVGSSSVKTSWAWGWSKMTLAWQSLPRRTIIPSTRSKGLP
ncbi:hypothetical protein Ahy_B08g094174 isoform C [Arachis hypogaea]|uniref:Uncharacterized protein n=1 Tax=Arachis hypogaea TaxID=3818 RepID=A0A444Y819_ARAHY|nr:hypothetical protein Ahy_B08g094174 isoform C [Arachis hypogaea]